MFRGCFGAGDFDRQPYVVIERIPGKTLYDRLGDLPLPYEEARVIGRQDRHRARRPAPAERHSSRHQAEQHHVPRKRRSRADRFRPVAPQSIARPAAGRIPPALRHRALHGAGAPARRARRSAQRPVFARRAAVFLHHGRAAVRRERNPARHAAAAVARSVSAAQAEAGLSALASGDRAAVPGNRTGLASSDRVATGVRTGPSRTGQAHRAIGAIAARSAHAPCGAAASTAG